MARVGSIIGIIPLTLMLIVQVQGHGKGLQRQKRHWIIPPKRLTENIDYTKKELIAKIRSDEESRTSIQYFLEGKGASETPVNLFTVNSENGFVRINGILDREEIDRYYLRGIAKFINGTRAEKDIDLIIEVEDQNDCSPVFSFNTLIANVSEESQTATFVVQIIADDADKPNTLHTQIAYSIVEQSPAGGNSLFSISKETGEIRVRQRLDRETQDTYTLTIKGTDMNGGPDGLSGTGKVVVKVLDVNDNVPTLEKNHYEAKVMENTFNVTVLRIKALDADLIHTDNWLAVFTIVSGNEAGYFSISTDAKTNEGILVLNKAINYEELKEIKLQVTVSNKAAYHSSTIITTTKSYPITIHVQNEPEGPYFKPSVKVVHVSEDHTTIDLKKVITTYKAIDSDTLQPATNVIYVKGEDRGSWITIDQTTAEIRLIKLPDRESSYLVNGTYYAKILCITKDFSAKTATGTIAIQVEDFNDHCPRLTSTSQTVCFHDNVVYATAVDEDAYPNGAPFSFTVGSNTKQQWSVEPLNDTTVILRPKKTLWPGIYKVFMTIEDQQGKACAGGQVLDLEVCSCAEGQGIKKCLPRELRGPSTTLGPAGILLLLLGLLMLLLLPLLLLFCLCGGAGVPAEDFKVMPWGAKEHLISYHTEGQGEDKDVPLLKMQTVEQKIGFEDSKGVAPGLGGFYEVDNNNRYKYEQWTSTMGAGHEGFNGQFERDHLEHRYGVVSGQFEQDHLEHRYGGASGQTLAFEGIALSAEFLEKYYAEKAAYVEELQPAKEGLVIYNYEGQDSPVGSVGCCSLLQDDHDLEFLNDLGPKFKTLANICTGASEVEFSNVKVTTPQPFTPHVTNIDISENISQSISAAKTNATNLGTISQSISAAKTNATNLGTISQSISAAKTDAVNLAASSALIQDSITLATRPATTNMHLQENIVVPTQPLLIQQPTLYYAAAPPVYIVDPQPHPTLLVGPTVGGAENLVVVERKATTGGSAQAVVGLENLQGAQSLVLVEGRATEAGDPQQILGTLGKRQVVMVEMQKGMGGASVNQIGQGAALTCGNVSLSETAVTAGSGGLQQDGSGGFIQVVPSQSQAGQSVEVRGHSAPLNVPLQTVHEGTHKMVVQETVSVRERHMQSSSTA